MSSDLERANYRFHTHSADQIKDPVTGEPIDIGDTSGLQPIAEKDQVNGYAGLDSGGKLLAAQLPGAAATDVETAAAVAALSSVYQPLDSDLTAIAALTTTSYGRALLALADAAAGRTAFGLGTASTHATGDYDAAGAAAAAQAASQPLDSDLTSIAALTTTSYGRAFLALADAAAGRTALGLGTAALSASGDFQPVDSDLTAIAALSTTSTGRSLLAAADAAALRTILGLGTAAVTAASAYEVAGAAAAAQAASQPLDSDLTAFAALAIAADKLPYGSGSHALSLADFTAAGRALVDDADAAAQLTTLGVSTFIKTLLDDTTAAIARATLGVQLKPIVFVIDGGGATITTGIKGDVEIPFAWTDISSVRLFADQSGSIVVNLWKDTYANFPPDVSDKITASAPPTISSATKAQDTTLTGWTKTGSAGDVIRFNVDSVTTIQRVTVSLVLVV